MYHGIIREQCKGSKYFIEALKTLSDKHGDKVEVHIVKRLPYEDYIKLFDEMDVLLDQTNTYGMGMNAEIGLMNGKVVLSGNEPENESELDLGNCPVINAIPDANYIYNKLEYLINNPMEIERVKLESRKFTEYNLDSKLIAARYLTTLRIE